ncbi:MAG: class I SAM-dependent methyltransferase [Candidatus Bathyarchaeota archaeon]|nr:class I SAM-dependent methyltransferase [Candidatus Bathyarchaeum sp.]
MSAKEYFNNAASVWDEKFHTPKLCSFLEKLVPQFGIETGQNVLDVGTGTGVLIPYLIKAVGPNGSVIAIDYSEKMVQQCKAKYSHIKNLTIKVGNIQEDTFPAQTFDVVTCFGVFPHLENKQKVLQNINSTLKPSGKLIIAHALSSEELKVHHKTVSHHVAHAMLPKNAEMTKLLEQAGFSTISIKDEPGFYLCIAHKT